MKKSILALAVFTFITASAVLSCKSSSDSSDNAANTGTTGNTGTTDNADNTATGVGQSNTGGANDDYMTDVESYRKETTDRITANEQSIKEFNARIANEKREAKAAYQKKIASLEKKNRDMKMKMDNYKGEGKENWEKFKTEFNHDMDELGKAFRDLTVNNVK